MADVKISALPELAGVIGGGEIIPVVEGGATKRITAQQIIDAVPVPGPPDLSAYSAEFIHLSSTGTGNSFVIDSAEDIEINANQVNGRIDIAATDPTGVVSIFSGGSTIIQGNVTTVAAIGADGSLELNATDTNGVVNVRGESGVNVTSALVSLAANQAGGAVTITAIGTGASLAFLATSSAALQTVGDGSQVDIAASGVGSQVNIVLRSPDGGSHLLQVDNAGVLSTTPI